MGPGVRQGTGGRCVTLIDMEGSVMQASKSGTAQLPVRTARVAADFMLLAGVSVIVGLGVAAAVSAVVILLGSAG